MMINISVFRNSIGDWSDPTAASQKYYECIKRSRESERETERERVGNGAECMRMWNIYIKYSGQNTKLAFALGVIDYYILYSIEWGKWCANIKIS